MIDMQKLDASRIETPTMPQIYVVHARRWGESETHSYIVMATLRQDDAMKAAEFEEYQRGGKYGCEVSCFNNGEKTIIRKPYNGRETFLTEKSS